MSEDKLTTAFQKIANKAMGVYEKQHPMCKVSYAKVACPNQIVGRIGDLSSGADFPLRINVEEVRKRSGSCVILILESPHKDEFVVDAKGVLNPIGPARGRTGSLIRSFFLRSFRMHTMNVSWCW